MTLTFSELLKKLYSYYGGQKSQQDFVVSILGSAVDDDKYENDEYWELLDKKDYLNKIFNGSKALPQKDDRHILKYLNKEGLYNKYLKDITTEDSLVELCEEFEPILGNSTQENIATKITALFVSVVKEIANKKIVATTTNKNELEKFTNLDLEQALAEIVKKLSNLTQPEMDVLLRFNPTNVATKINQDNLLKNDVLDDVSLYYNYINELLKEASKANSVFVDRLTKAVQFTSDSYISQGLKQTHVFNNIVEWLKTKSLSANTTACKIMASFFVQNCEVFYETTE